MKNCLTYALLVVLFAIGQGFGAEESDEKRIVRKYADFSKRVRQVVRRDGFPVLNNPKMVTPTAAERSRFIADHFPVLGVVVDGKARAYPIGKLGFHELVNDTIGKVPIVVSW